MYESKSSFLVSSKEIPSAGVAAEEASGIELSAEVRESVNVDSNAGSVATAIVKFVPLSFALMASKLFRGEIWR